MYTILQDHEGGLVLVIDLQSSAPKKPMFIYDGGDTALLFRDWDSSIRINKISDEARPILKNAEDIYVIELQGEDILRDYFAPIRIVKDVQKLIA